ncbi:dihydrodipicolinate synthase family protein [Actinopolymorpha alba]|uniref:dihydrodipicolinate synthase family protein n=1 Tax=Actinopolymorpha alba TaxID=533267 RepID=UPI0003730599|nr:dihydrodipicolinate synthase family protein [Actinopolymorpha alba]
MTDSRKPWHGVLVATPVPLRPDLSVDLDRFAEHLRWLAENGCHGITPNGSLGEYQTLTPQERAAVVTTAIEAAPAGFTVMPGVGAYGTLESRRWAEQAAEAGAPAVMLLPPNSYRADERAVVDHYREVAKVGLPIVAYNNPYDTRVDLTPPLLARLFSEELIVGVKEFSLDPRRAYEIHELAPGLDVIAGSDDTVLEFAIAGARGWISGFPSSFPRSLVRFFAAAQAGDLATALPLYRALHPLLRWDSKPEFVQAIKLSMDLIGRYGGPCRPPRVPLAPEQERAVREATEKALAAGLD